MKILVTGDTGFIGSSLKGYLTEQGHEVVGFSRRSGYDVLNFEQLSFACKNSELVYHCAAVAKPGESFVGAPYHIEINVKGMLNVLEACKKNNIPLIYTSSCEIYGDSMEPLVETSEFKPTNPYASSKVATDRICYTYFKSYGLDVKIARLFNPYGPNQQRNKIMTTFISQAITDKPITIYGDGSDMRDYVYIDDILRGLWLTRNLPAGEAVNFATGRATTTLEVANLIKKFVGSRSEIKFVDYPTTHGKIMKQVGSFEKARRLLNWRPLVTLEEGIHKMIEVYGKSK